MEILAPAGGPEALRAAVFAGADAVYLGGPAFGARAHAQNFSREQLREAAEFCHARGVRIHVTVNTLLKDEELPAALDFVEFLCGLPVDAVLVQDMGLFSLLRAAAPDLPLHASTQMGLHTPGGAALLHELGAARVVLARELSLPEIREIADGCPIELESFIHGALCMSVSGQCYFSAMLGGRSGNRGQCAQPCRLPFAAPGGTGHDLSLKDLSFIGEMDRLQAAGVCSAKIEGRMKRPEYVAAAARACRLAADGEPVPPELEQALRSVFARSGFTDGYLTARRGRGMFGVRTKEDVTGATGQVLSSLRALYSRERGTVPVAMALEKAAGEIVLTVWDREGFTAQARAQAGEAPLPLLDRARCLAQLGKTGGTPFRAEEIAVPEAGVALGVSALNALRREALDGLLRRRARREAVPFHAPGLDFPPHPARIGPLPVRGYFRLPEQVPAEALGLDAIALPLATPLPELLALRERGFERILIELPRAAFGAERQTKEKMCALMDGGFCEFICGGLGDLRLGRELGAVLHGGFGLNITNTAALEFFRRQGMATAEVSFELTGREAGKLGGGLPRGVMLYGRQALMLTRNCPLANGPGGCRHCKTKTPGCLTDRMQRKFPVVCTGQGAARYAEVLNSVPLWLGDKPHAGADFGVLRFTVENAVESGRVLNAWFRQGSPGFDYTRGLYARGVE